MEHYHFKEADSVSTSQEISQIFPLLQFINQRMHI